MKALVMVGTVMLASLLGGCGGYAASGDRDAAAGGSVGSRSSVTVFGTIDAGVSRTTRTDR